MVLQLRHELEDLRQLHDTDPLWTLFPGSATRSLVGLCGDEEKGPGVMSGGTRNKKKGLKKKDDQKRTRKRSKGYLSSYRESCTKS